MWLIGSSTHLTPMLGTSGVSTLPMTTPTASVTPLRTYPTRCAQRSFRQGLNDHPPLPLFFHPSISHSVFLPLPSIQLIVWSIFHWTRRSSYYWLCNALNITVLSNGSTVDSISNTLSSQRERSRNLSLMALLMTGMTLVSSHSLLWDEGDFPPRPSTTSVPR